MSGAGSYYLSEEMIEFINNAINRMYDDGQYQFSGCNCTKCIYERKYEEFMSIEKKLRKEQKWKESEQLNSDFRIFERKLNKVDKYV